MPFFLRSLSNKRAAENEVKASNVQSKSEPYKHIPVHAARDALSQMPPSAREADRQAITDHHKRRSQMPQHDSPILSVQQHLPSLMIDTDSDRKNLSANQRDVPYIGKGKPPHTSRRPIATLRELNHLSAQQKIRASRRAAHIEPTAEVIYHLGLLPSPLSYPPASFSSQESPLGPIRISSSEQAADVEEIALPVRKHPPLLVNQMQAGSDSPTPSTSLASCMSSLPSSSQIEVAIAVKASNRSYFDERPVRWGPPASSQEPLNPPPVRSRARDSISRMSTEDPRFHKPKSGSKRAQRLRAAPHDTTGIEQAMSAPNSFQPRRAPPLIKRNGSADPVMPIPGFDFGATAERPYSPDRLRPWLANSKHNAFQHLNMATMV